MSIEAMKQALEALEPDWELAEWYVEELQNKAITALRERLAQPEQEPFGYFQLDLRLDAWVQNRDSNKGVAFYTTPPQRKPLTDDEADELVRRYARYELIRAIEAAHGIKE